jgi:uncharacterized protein with ParB-like and HNH nuclease domain
MQFEEGTLHKMIFGTSQHLEIPQFQRPYSWDKDLWKTIWIDVLHQYVNYQKLVNSYHHNVDEIEKQLEQQAKHYLGAIVTDSGSAMIPPRSKVLDGQQRLLTCSVLYLAVRDAHILGIEKVADQKEAHDKIYAAYKDGFKNAGESGESELRIKPQAVDLPAWTHLLDPSRQIKTVKPSEVLAPKNSTKLIDAYNFFLKELRRKETPNDFYEIDLADNLFPLDFDVLKKIILTRLWMVKILCSTSDDVNAIFESLNAKSKPLQQVDLIKNYLYLSLKSRAESVYSSHWVPLENTLGHENLERYVWAYTVSTGENISQRKTYESVRRQLPPAKSDEIEKWVIELKAESNSYARILKPELEMDLEIKSALQDLKAANGATAEPLILYCFREYHKNKANKTEFIQALRLIESLMVRRMIAGIPTQMLNPMFGSLCGKLFQSRGAYSRTGELVIDISRLLSGHESNWPDDEQVLHGIRTNNFYHSQKTEQRMHVLTNIDRALGGGVLLDYPMSDKTIEHVIPQSLPAGWRACFNSEELEYVESNLNALVNLAILPRPENSQLGNLTWDKKRVEYAGSNYYMIKDMLNYEIDEKWSHASLESRAEKLLQIVKTRWPRTTLLPHKTDHSLPASG